MVTDNLCCQLRTLSQKIKTYYFCNPMNTFAPNTLEVLHQKNIYIYTDPMDFIAAKVFFKEEKINLDDFIKEN